MSPNLQEVQINYFHNASHRQVSNSSSLKMKAAHAAYIGVSSQLPTGIVTIWFDGMSYEATAYENQILTVRRDGHIFYTYICL